MKPQMLCPGDKIGILAPSFCGPAYFPHRVANGKRFLESLGYEVVLAANANGRHKGYLSGTAAERTADIHQLFADPSVRAIVGAIGGDHSCHLLPHLDWELIRRNPKIFMGYSDVTVLNLAIYAKTGLTTFNGPALMTDFAEFPQPFAYTIDAFTRTLCRAEAPGQFQPASAWTEELLDWSKQLDQARPRAMTPSPGWTWLKEGRAQGRLVGGCLESLQHLRGTPYWPDFTGAILFWETSEERPRPGAVDAILQDYANMGLLEQLSGMIVGRSVDYSPEWKEELRAIILERTAPYRFPIITDMDFGHNAPQFILPVGCWAEIDSNDRRFAIVEPAVLV